MNSGIVLKAAAAMNKPSTKTTLREGKPTWVFKARFRRHAFGWRSQPAIISGFLVVQKTWNHPQ